MLDYRLFRHQNFFKKSQKKLDFLPKNGKICVKKCLFFKKFSKIFFALYSFFLSYFFTLICKKAKNALCFRRAHEKLSVIFRK